MTGTAYARKRGALNPSPAPAPLPVPSQTPVAVAIPNVPVVDTFTTGYNLLPGMALESKRPE